MDLFSAGAAFVITSTVLLIPRFRRWYFGVFELDKKLEIKKPVEDGTVRWCVNGYNGAYCFKCTMWTKKDPSPVGPLCDCPEYEKPHFHFQCGACGFKTIMRTADDRRAEEKAQPEAEATMIPQFCKACGGRLEEMDREFCKAKECQAFARRDVVMRARSDEGTFPSTISKDALLAALQEDINRQVPRERADALRLLRDEVRKHPWDDVSKFDKTRRRLLEAFKTNPNRWQMPEETRIGVDLAKHLGDEVLKRFKNDLTRLALSEPVEGVRLRVDRNVFRSYTDDATGATDVHITATADVPVLFHPMLRDIVVAPCDGDAELFSVPRGRTYADRVEADYNEIADAIKEGRVKKRHVHLAQGAGLDGCAMHFGLYRHQNIWDVQSKVTIPMEPDVNFRKRILAVMPLERGDEVRTWDSGLAGVSIDRMTGAVSDNPSRGRIAGKFDASHGFHLDTVAEMNGIKRKGGETDEMLRSRLYQATEE